MPRLLPLRRPNTSDEMIHAARIGRLSPIVNPESEWPESWKRVAFRDATQLQMVPLGTARRLDVVDLMLRHESSRDLRPVPILAEQVATLMTAIAINRNGSAADFTESRRTYPSGGARYPIDVYLLLLRCEGIDPGGYMFDPRAFALRQIERRDFSADVRGVFGEDWVASSSLVVFFVAQWERSRMKYGDRGYPFAFLETGHMAQNLILVGNRLGLRSCPIGGFWERKVEDLFHLVTPEEAPIYSLVIGWGEVGLGGPQRPA